MSTAGKNRVGERYASLEGILGRSKSIECGKASLLNGDCQRYIAKTLGRAEMDNVRPLVYICISSKFRSRYDDNRTTI